MALRAVESARQAAESGGADARAAHVGYHLIGEGRARPRGRRRLPPAARAARARRLVFAHATAALPRARSRSSPRLAASAAASRYARAHGGRRGRSQLAWRCSLLLPASELAIALVQRARRAASRRRGGCRASTSRAACPRRARTMVVVPTLLDERRAASSELLEHLEVLALGNLDPRIHFAILSDFADAAAREMPGRRRDPRAPRAPGIEALNARHARGARATASTCSTACGSGTRARASGWAGSASAARSRSSTGCCAGATDTSFAVQVGDASRPARASATASRSTPTRACRATPRKKLIGIIAHPLQPAALRPARSAASPRATASCSRASASPWRAPPARSSRGSTPGHTGVDPYTTAVSDTYQDLFGEGIFTGKGLYDVDAFTAALEGRVPENALLSHDLFEGLYARTALVTDVEVVDDYPVERPRPRAAPAPLGARRLADPVLAASRACRRARGLRAQPPAAHQPLEDPRQPAAQPGGAGDRRAAARSAGRCCPGSPAVWTRGGRSRRSPSPLLARRSRAPAAARRPQQPWRVFLRDVVRRTRATALRAGRCCSSRSSPSQACEMVHAIGLTLVRLVVTQRRLLEWETAAASAARGAGLRRASGARALRRRR